MLAPLSWMKEYIDFSGEANFIANALTMAGIPVEEIHELGKEINNVVTGKLISVEKHPNADKLVVCQVDVGDDLPLQVCTGATNVRAGQVVPVAKPNAHLPGGIHIKRSKLRGIPSDGMLCSAKELGLNLGLLSANEKEGIYIMPEETPVGVDIHRFLGLDETIFEFELTPNRADCFSMIGLAREFSALLGGVVKEPTILINESGNAIEDEAAVEIEALDGCERFTARLLRDVKVTKSPSWLAERLNAIGIRSINNVVDVTNYVMHEYGLPLHAYDFDTLTGKKLICRYAKTGEKLVTLDGIERALEESYLVIADENTPAGMAGVMGGERTEVTDRTTSILLEAAVFNGAIIRRASRKVGLRSEASGRYERGVDASLTTRALDRAAQLLQQMNACTIAPGYLDVYPNPRQASRMDMNIAILTRAIGVNITESEIIDILRRLQFEVELIDRELHIQVPPWRADVTCIADIVEEIARIYGYDEIPSTLPKGRSSGGKMSKQQQVVESISNALVSMGLSETISFSFMNSKALHKLHYPQTHDVYQFIPVLNPITEEMSGMRTSLLPGLMQVLERNLSVKNEDVAIFEYGALFIPKELPLKELPHEKKSLAGLVTGIFQPRDWMESGREVDFYDLKGMMEQVLDLLRITEYEIKRADNPVYHPGKSAEFWAKDQLLLTFGELHPEAQELYGFKNTVYVFEMEIETMIALATSRIVYDRLPKYPAIERDLAILAPIGVAHEDIQKIIKMCGGDLLEHVALFDLYRGDQVPDGFISMAFSLSFRADDRTLTDSEIDEKMNLAIQHLSELNCRLR